MIRLKEYGYIPTTAKTKFVTVKMSSVGRWFVSVLMEEEVSDSKDRGSEILGVDLGLTDFAATSDGEEVEHPKFLKRKEKSLKRCSRRVSRKAKGSKNRRKAQARLAIQHFRVACARKDFLHKLSSRLVRTKPVIVLEDLNVKGMQKNHRLAKSIGDSGWGEFKRQCKYKAEWSGGRVIEADRFFPSTKRCSCCGVINSKIELDEREWDCPSCGAHLKRDPNASQNLKWYGEQVLVNEARLNTVSSTGINACGEESSDVRNLWRETGLGEAGSLKHPSIDTCQCLVG